MDAFDSALAGFRKWAETVPRPGDPDDDIEEAELLLDLMRHLGIARPADLTTSGLELLLLELYPGNYAAEDIDEAEQTLRVMRDLLACLALNGALAPAKAKALNRKLDAIGPSFVEAVLADDEDDDVDIKEAFDLPDVLPPVRLPSEAELAAMARATPMTGQLLALGAWVGDGRPVDENQDLAAADAAEAAADLSLEPRDLPYLWRLALDGEFVELDEAETHAIQGELTSDWHDIEDEEVLEVWDVLFGLVLGTTLEVVAAHDPRRARELDMTGHGGGLAVLMFLARAQGLPVAEASEIVQEAATGELPAEQADKAWQSWIRAHGDPAQLLLDQMVSLGAVDITEDTARLTPLGLMSIRDQLEDAEVEVPLLPLPAQMTPALLLAMADASPEDFEAEVTAWKSYRTPEAAAVELLDFAARADAADRIIAAGLAVELGAAAEAAWNSALDIPELRGYAKGALAQLTGEDAPDLEPGEMAWMLLDGLVLIGWDDVDPEADDLEPLLEALAEAIPAGREPEVFEGMWRTGHPDAAAVLTEIGNHHPDKTITKAARKSAYKAASSRKPPSAR
jgi:hypothetical protein